MPLRTPAEGGDRAKGASQGRNTEYGTFSTSKSTQEPSQPAQKSQQKSANTLSTPESKSPVKKPDALPLLHPESPSTAWWRKLFFEVFDKRHLDSELDSSQVWELTPEHTSAEASAAFREVYAQSRKWLLYVTALGEVLLHCHSHFLGFKINIKIMGALRALVFENTISQPEHIPGHAAGSYDSECGKKRMAEVAHLYAEDVVNVAKMVTHMQFLWRSVLQIVFELCILVQVIGIKFKPIAIAFLFMAVFVKFLSAAGSRLRRKLQKKIDARLNVIHECFKGIQMVKLNAWEDKMQEKIERARKEENRERRRVNVVAALQYCVGVDSPNL
ncbi:ATP-binding cassette (ABC) Superfamily, partial [Phytophthora palmivora]